MYLALLVLLYVRFSMIQVLSDYPYVHIAFLKCRMKGKVSYKQLHLSESSIVNFLVGIQLSKYIKCELTWPLAHIDIFFVFSHDEALPESWLVILGDMESGKSQGFIFAKK